MQVLIIGGSGHVSGAVARAALAAGHTVWAVTRGQRPLAEGIRALVADRHDGEAMAQVVASAEMRWDLVVDCICFDEPAINQDIQLFRDRAAQLVLISTDFVYDPVHRHFPQSEETEQWETVQEYGRKKRLCEEVLLTGDTGEMAWTVVRPCHIYGPTSELGCLPLHGRDPELIPKLYAGEALQLVGGGYFLQQPILADDLAAVILSVAGNPMTHRQCFNAAGPDIIESHRYYEIIAEVLGVALTVTELPVAAALAEHPEMAPFLCHRIYDLRKLAACGLAVPSTPIKEGLRRHVEGLMARKGLLIV
ncbi:MAG: NAD-dependent epimerase/dehydratase family protein [Armatimonadota bacterium]